MSTWQAAQTTRRDHALGALMMVVYVGVLLATVEDLGMSRDESTYVHAANRHADWYEQLLADPGKAVSAPVIKRHFEFNREHPPLVKTLFGFAHALDERFTLFPAPSTGYRVVGMLSAGALLWLIYIMGVAYGGRWAGAFGALCYALLPRPFYHAHLNCFDVPITLAVTLVCHAYLKSLLSRRWAIYGGLLFGCALATKHNSWVLPGIFAIHHAFVVVQQRRAARSGPVSTLPMWLVAMAILGPLVLVASWPWLWHDGVQRFAWYVSFHMRHDYYNMAYFGENYFRPPFPVSFPWVMTLFTVPLTTLLVALGGLVTRLRRLLARVRDPAATGDPVHTDVLYLGAMLAPILMIALPSTPIFGGTKHWMTAYPFMCLFAGAGFVRLSRGLSELLAQHSGDTWFVRLRARLSARLGAFLLATILLVPALVETAHSHPFGLSHYGVAAGGVPGAADLGMNRQFWGFTTRGVTDYLNAALPEGGQVYVCDTTPTAFRMLAEDGFLRPSIQPTMDIARSDLALVHHEHHFAEVDFQIWSAFGTVEPATVLTYDGVPIVSVYRNPASRKARARERFGTPSKPGPQPRHP